MAKIEQDLKQLFENNFDCYAEYDKNGAELSECFDISMAMTKQKFVEVVNNLLSELEVNKANSYNGKLPKFDISSLIDFKEMRKNFFKEHTFKDNFLHITKVVTHPHNIFEWFKAEIIEYLKAGC
jgi:polyphosphate kinase